jgi:ABC-type multidrug transport system fused ATPase/permease subunit
MVGLSVRPYLVARAIDDGLRAHNNRALAMWILAIVVAGVGLAYLGIMRHRTMTFVREDATARSAGVLLRHLSRLGAVLPRKLAAGEVATVTGTDIGYVSHVLTMTGPGVGAVIAYAVVAAVLWSFSPLLAVFVLLGVPSIALLIGPLLRRLERAESAYRHEQGLLTARATDIVAGLRVLAGVGGRGLFARRYAARSQRLLAEGYRVGAVSSWIEAMMIVIPGIFLAAVVWLSARMAAGGEISIGEMVAVYGYVAILVVPVWFLIEGGYQMIRGRVAARRIIALLSLAPDEVGGRPGVAAPDRPADLHDPMTGLTVAPDRLLGVAASNPAEAVALADRLGRFVVSDVTWGGVPLAGVPLDAVRERILVADHDSYIFGGTLRDILRVRGRTGDAETDDDKTDDKTDDDKLLAALRTASAEDVADALPQGLATPVATRARTLSGGERQRVRLARALLAEPEVLILLDPSSAVDAHTEARIAQRLREARAGKATVVLTTSPLMLGHTDAVAFLDEGRIAATGTHSALVEHREAYRALVHRDSDIEASDVEASDLEASDLEASGLADAVGSPRSQGASR